MRSFRFDRFSWKIRLPLEAKTLLSLKHIINLCTRFLAVNFSWNIPKNALNVLIIVTCILISWKENPLPPLPAEFDCIIVSSFQSVLFAEIRGSLQNDLNRKLCGQWKD